MGEVLQDATPFQELGVSGLRRAAGYLDEEFLPQLKGRRAVQIYREMSENDAIIGALLFSIRNLIRNVDWQVTPGGKSTDHAKAAKFVEECMDDMSHSWDSMILEVLTSLVYGWSWHEIVYKRRMGIWQKDGRHRSNFNDGLIGWRKIPMRAQETMQRWVFDDSGGIQGMVQMAPPDYTTRFLPIERSLLFRYGHTKNSPEGVSMLRNAYRSWFYKKRLEEFESIGVERDLAGLPKVGVPSAWLKAPPGSPQAKQVEAFKKMVRGLRRNEQEGVVFPIAYDEETKQPMFTLELMGSGGGRQFQTDPIIQRYATWMLMTVLADFIMVGHEESGTYNMHVDKSGIFKTSLNATTNSIADVFNRHAIPRLFAVNGWKPAELPKITPSDVDAPNLTELAGFLSQTAQLGFNWTDPDMEKFLRNAAGLPDLSEADTARHRTMMRRQEATQYAQVQAEYLAARSQLAAAQMGEPTGEDAAMQQQVEGGAIDNQAKAADVELKTAQGAQQLASGVNEEKRKQEMHQAQLAQAKAAAKATLMGAQAKKDAAKKAPAKAPAKR
jgi:hypothetical protein